MLTREEILLIMGLLSQETVVPPSKKFPYRISVEGHGYSKDPKIGPLQAKLSIMLEVAARREPREEPAADET
jgi:hypothetical protein